MHWSIRRTLAVVAAGGLCLVGTAAASAAPAPHHLTGGVATATPIKHLVVIFDENVSFDHYFGTYPNAANTDGNTFTPLRGTPSGVQLDPNCDLGAHSSHKETLLWHYHDRLFTHGPY